MAVKSLQQSINSIEVKVGHLIHRQEMLESTVNRVCSRLEQNGALSRKEVLPVSPATARSNSMTPVPPRLPAQPALPAGRPQMQSSKSVGGKPPPSRTRGPDSGCYTGSWVSNDMGEPATPGSTSPRRMTRFVPRNSNGYDDVEDNYSSSLKSTDIEGEENGGNYVNQLTTDSFEEPAPLLVSMTIEASVGKPNAVHLYNSITRDATKLASPAVPTGKRVEGTKQRSLSISKDSRDSEDSLTKDTTDDSDENSRKSGHDGEDAQGPFMDEDWEKYPEFDIERFSQFRRFTRDEAAAKLAGQVDGVYLIRPCGDTSLKNNPDVFVLSFFGRNSTNQRCLTNIKIFRSRHGKTRGLKLGGQNPELFPTLVDLLKQHLPDLRPFDEESLIPKKTYLA